jgi:hypothetical protein
MTIGNRLNPKQVQELVLKKRGPTKKQAKGG